MCAPALLMQPKKHTKLKRKRLESIFPANTFNTYYTDTYLVMQIPRFPNVFEDNFSLTTAIGQIFWPTIHDLCVC